MRSRSSWHCSSGSVDETIKAPKRIVHDLTNACRIAPDSRRNLVVHQENEINARANQRSAIRSPVSAPESLESET